jgi:hypothetical protein
VTSLLANAQVSASGPFLPALAAAERTTTRRAVPMPTLLIVVRFNDQ